MEQISRPNPTFLLGDLRGNRNRVCRCNAGGEHSRRRVHGGEQAPEHNTWLIATEHEGVDGVQLNVEIGTDVRKPRHCGVGLCREMLCHQDDLGAQ